MINDNDRIQWHRLAGLVLKPLFERLGYETEIEVDLSLKKQLVDIITVRKAQYQVDYLGLPKIYWEAFSDLNEHNMLSFKSYSESFGTQALEELYGHLSNYKKVKKVKWKQINLYALTHHYPRKLFRPFEGTEFLETIKENEIFDFKLQSLKKVRFIIMQETDNPLLALFSNNPWKVAESHHQLAQQKDLLENVSLYFKKISEYHFGKEIANMYTQEDFFRDYPPSDIPFVVPWLQELHEERVRKATQEARREAEQEAEEARRQVAETIKQAEEAIREAELKARKQAEQARKEAELKARKQAEQARKEAELNARKQAEQARKEAELNARKQAELKARKQTEEAIRQAELKAQKREKIGVLTGRIKALQSFYERGIISEEMYHSEALPLKKELDELEGNPSNR